MPYRTDIKQEWLFCKRAIMEGERKLVQQTRKMKKEKRIKKSDKETTGIERYRRGMKPKLQKIICGVS